MKNLTGYDLKPEHTVEEIETLFEKLIESILYTETYRLDRKLPDAINIDKSIKAKSDFYKSLIQNSKIRAIGFDRSHDFPIGRDKFPHHLSKDRIREIEPEKELVEGIIISPVTVDRDNSWTFLDKKSGKIIRAKMRDDEFKKEFLGGKHPLKESVSDDTFLVNVVYRMQERNGEPEIRETLISDVFSMNGKEIKESKTANDGGEKQSPDLPLFEHARFTDKRSRRTT
ncbi:hypothetical protein C882_0052 [Caenispirillum salinarum AK4]|uniref:Uncharacterized protein n=1 Tax=Caenispirillum salinarum AK4 TaxID=1238182 RepID=K9HN45_9PROT|nr:hypothetical protein C882_0052 [Caenispirillum salinarum AK4]